MTSKPQKKRGDAIEKTPLAADGDGVVISGMAGTYPQARYVKDLQNILYNKINPVSNNEQRWKYNHPEVAQNVGNVPDLTHFDTQFFKSHYKLAKAMDPVSRKLLELAYEAIYDAGVNPMSLSGKKIGVYIGACFSEAEKIWTYNNISLLGFGVAGCNKSMFANRISYWLNAKGPSMCIDQACCSSIAALEAAYDAIRRGECEAALVGGGSLCLHPQTSVHYGRIISISKNSTTKSFSEDAEGCVRSEAVNCLFLQKTKNAKRIYANLVHVKSEFVSFLKDDTGPRYGFYRDPDDTNKFLKTFYEEAGVSPTLVEYVEAFGSAVPEVDKSELEVIDTVFCSDKAEPLLVGSVMSNIGYGEAASGVSAVTKVLLGYHTGSLAGNLHCSTPRRDVAALREGRMRVLTDNQPFQRTYAAVNSMSVTGVNAHVLLHGHYKRKVLDHYKADIPRLVTISSRQELDVKKVLDYLKSQPIDPEELALLHSIHETDIRGHLGKGYIIIDTQHDGKTYSLSQRAGYCDSAQRPLWFVYSGMGSQWAGMGEQLMRIPIFAAAIQRCHKALEPKGLDIIYIITSRDQTIFNNILNSFVGIAAVQIGLTDVLLELGLVPDKIIGHSVGELGCAYADGCLTAEEMILAAYSRGRVSLETPFIHGSMAAVGVGAQEMSSICPPEIEIACHNSAESCTISGPADAMHSFVTDLTARGIFAKEVPCSNIAYHSRYIAKAGPNLLKYLKKVISIPRARSSRWVSSSVPRERWDDPSTKYSSAEYHTNNLLSPVLFEEASALIPADAVLVEVAPHGLLQAILKRALPDSAVNISLARRGRNDNVQMVLEAIGNLYILGYNPKVQVLYPKVEFPVSTGTPFLSNYVKWAHLEEWALPLHEAAYRGKTASYTVVVSLHDDTSYLQGCVYRNKTLLPFSFALVSAWDTLAMSLDVPRKSLSVEFRDVKLYTQPILHEQRTVRLSVALHRGSGRFEIMYEDSNVATGFINVNDSASSEIPDYKIEHKELSVQDVYQELYERGYAYSGEFRSIVSTNIYLSDASVSWNDNWVTFIDSLFQLNTLKYTRGGISQPDRIRKMVIDSNKHIKIIQTNKNNNNKTIPLLNVKLSEIQDRTSCGGVIIENIRFRNVLQTTDEQVALYTHKFVSRFDSKFDVFTSLYILLQIIAENVNKDLIKIIGISNNCHAQLFEKMEKIAVKGIPGVKKQYQYKHIDTLNNHEHLHDADVVLVQRLSLCENISERFQDILGTNIFIINEENVNDKVIHVFPSKFYDIVSVLNNDQTRLELARWRPISCGPLTSTYTVRAESDLSSLIKAHKALSSQNGYLIITSCPPVAGLLSLVKTWSIESTSNRIHVIMIDENHDGIFSSDEVLNAKLAFNLFQNNSWGGEYYLPLEEFCAARDEEVLRSQVNGDLNSLKWVQAPKVRGPGVLVAVHYTAINISDVNQAVELIPQNNTGFGIDFSGLTNSGERVMGLSLNGAASTYIMAQSELMWPVPASWSLEDAVTVPFAYSYAYYCLVIKSNTRFITDDISQYSVLVHGGAGALGQAAISIALARGWRVFTTVSDSHKKRFLMRLFPQLNENDIGNSRDNTFGDMVLNATNGKGCNIVLSCVKPELKNVSLKCCAPSSTVLDTTQILNTESFSYGMHNLMFDKSYIAVDIKRTLCNLKSEDVRMLHSLVSEGVASGEVRPLSRLTFTPDEVTRAFRLLETSRHRGRVLLRLADKRASLSHRAIYEVSPLYIIISESNNLGSQVVDKLIDNGIQNLHLHFNALNGHLQYKISLWEKRNVRVSTTYGGFDEISSLSDTLQNAVNIETTEAVHIILHSCGKENFINKIDSITRIACPNLKHFMVLSHDGCTGRYTCAQRAKSGLPATLLDLSLLQNIRDVDGGSWYRSVTVAFERALHSSEPILVALPELAPHKSLLQQIADLAELNTILSNEASSSTSLEQLGMSKENLSMVSALLRDAYNTYIDKDRVPLLTIERINDIEERASERMFKELRGLNKFYTNVDTDELVATTEVVVMPTLGNFAWTNEFDVNETYLCIVPGLEGHHKRFRALCERLKLPAFVLQPGLDYLQETPQELALRYSKVLLKKTCLKGKFYILGYETGVVVALELAAILEEQGLTGTVFCLGAGPEETVALLDLVLSEFSSDEALQEAVVRHMFSLMQDGTDAHVERALRGCCTWSERVDACVRALLGRVPHTAQYARAVLESAYARLSTSRHPLPPPRGLRSQLVLLRARPDTRVQDTRSLQRYSHRPVDVRDLTAPIEYAAADLKASAIINSYLDSDILQAFEKKNLCDSHLMDAKTL